MDWEVLSAKPFCTAVIRPTRRRVSVALTPPEDEPTQFQLTPKLELNGVLAEDNAFASDVRGFATDANNGWPLDSEGNRGALGNVIYRPRSDLLLSCRIQTFAHVSPSMPVPASQTRSILPLGYCSDGWLRFAHLPRPAVHCIPEKHAVGLFILYASI